MFHTIGENEMLISSIDSATMQEMGEGWARRTAHFALSGCEAAERSDRRAATAGGIDGISEYLNDLAERERNASFREEAGFSVTADQLPLWAGLSLWFEGRVIGRDGLPIGPQSAMDWRIAKALEEIQVSRPERVQPLKDKLAKRIDTMRSAVARVESFGESEEVPERWLSMAVDVATDRVEFLKRATFAPVKELEASILIIEGWIATT